MLAEHEGPDTERDRPDDSAAEDREDTVSAHNVEPGNEGTRAHPENARPFEESRVGHHTRSRDAGTRVGDTSSAAPGEPERRGQSSYLEELAEGRVDNPIATRIERSRDDVSRTSGSALDAIECAIVCRPCPDSCEGAS
jgi:hypothetical protein